MFGEVRSSPRSPSCLKTPGLSQKWSSKAKPPEGGFLPPCPRRDQAILKTKAVGVPQVLRALSS
jgi:hypothetical protein